ILVLIIHIPNLFEEIVDKIRFKDELVVREARVELPQCSFDALLEVGVDMPAVLELFVFFLTPEILTDNEEEVDVMLGRRIFGEVRKEILLTNDAAELHEESFEFDKGRFSIFVDLRLP